MNLNIICLIIVSSNEQQDNDHCQRHTVLIYCFDIDDTICKTKGQNYTESQPIHNRIKIINNLYDEGNIILFSTARGMGRTDNCVDLAKSMFFDLTAKQLNDWGVKYHKLFLGKPSGDFYVDDKGVKDEDFFESE